MKENSFIEKMLNFVFGQRSEKKKSKISPKDAHKIQKEYKSSCQENCDFSQPYVEIAKQLFSPKTEIFTAAVYYLQKIAQNNQQDRRAIIALLENYATQHALKSADKQLINDTISSIKRYN